MNAAATVTAGAAGIIIARSLGPAVRGHYAALQVWFELMLAFGAMGQMAATTYFVARHPEQGPEYVATSRNIMLATGSIVVLCTLAASPLLAGTDFADGRSQQLIMATVLVSLAGTAYTFALMAERVRLWNVVRVVQPLAYIAAILILHATGNLALTSVLVTLLLTCAMQATLAYRLCGRMRLTHGRSRRSLAKPMARYGIGHLAATAPALMVARVDQLVLSLIVPAVTLGHYAVAASLTLLAWPVVTALGQIALPRLASRRVQAADAAELQRLALVMSALISVCAMVLLCLAAPWLVPLVFGPEFVPSVSLLWLLAPGGVFLACGAVCGDLLRGRGRPLSVAKAQGCAAVLSLALIAALTPAYGVYGAAIASSISSALALGMMLRALGRPSPAASTGTISAPSESPTRAIQEQDIK